MRTGRLHARSKRRRTVYLEKLTLFMIAFVFAACLSIFGDKGQVSAHGNRQDEPVDYRYYRSIQVSSGDTLWNIAEEYMDDSYDSIPEYVQELKEINQLDSSQIHEGRYLTVTYTDHIFR